MALLTATLAHCFVLVGAKSLSAQVELVDGRRGENGKSAEAIGSEPSESVASPDSTPDPGRSADRVEYVGPDTYILLDEDGRPQPMPGMTYDDFMAAWRQSLKLETKSSEPRFVIDAEEIEGRTLDRHAELRIKYSIRLFTDERVAVPLGLTGAILDRRPTFQRVNERSTLNGEAPRGSGGTNRDDPPYLHYDREQGGFIAWFSAKPNDEYTVELNVLVPLVRNGTARILQLNCPRALNSKLTLTMDGTIADASVSDGALLTRNDSPDGTTRLEVVGIAGQFQLTWNDIETEVGEPATVLSASGRIDISIDGRSAQTRAQLFVQSFGGEFDRFRVRLPQGAKLVPKREPDGTATRKDGNLRISIEPDSASTNLRSGVAPERQVVLVELPEKQQGPVELNLSTEQSLGLVDEDLAVEMGGFEIVGAVRQFGDVALRIADDWQSRWEAASNVRQVDPSELATSLQQADITAAFQYDRQPWSLGVRLAAQSLRIHVTPEYMLDCLPDEARLRTRLAYQVLGARAFGFRVDLKGWELTADPIESGGLVDRDGVVVTREGTLILPLLQASSRRAEIAFNLRRASPRDEERLALPLPVPMAESVGGGSLIVRAAPGIELIPDLTRFPGLSALPALDSETTNSTLEEFRFRTLMPELVFAAERIIRPREVASEVITSATLMDSEIEVAERMNYVVSHESIQELNFEIPPDLAAANPHIDVSLALTDSDEPGRQAAEMPLSFQHVRDELARTSSAQSDLIRVTLVQPRMGRFTVVIRYTVPRSQLENNSDDLLLPLIQPADGRVTAQRATVRAPREFSISLQDTTEKTSWELRSHAARSDTGPTAIEFVSTRRDLSLPLSVQTLDVNTSSATTIERVWLQAWVADNIRQDRAAFRFRTAGRAVTVELPPDTAPDEVEARLNGTPAKVVTREPGRLVVWLTGSTRSDRGIAPEMDELHTLELRYRRPSAGGLIVRRLFSPPQLIGAAGLSQVYWHIVLPGGTHVVRSPRNLTSVSAWQWLGTFWGRRPTKSQTDLEEWAGASHQLEPTPTQNEYLFTGLAPVMSIEVVTAPRWLIVVLASSLFLAVSLLWIYIPAVRRAGIVLGLACVVAILATVFPTPAVLLGQAAALGMFLSILAAFIARVTTRAAFWTQPARSGGSSLRRLTPRTESALASPLSMAASTAPTTPLRAADSSP